MREYFSKRMPIIWILLSLIIVWGDYLSGPLIQFPILFTIPVALSSWLSGKKWGLSLAVALPFSRLIFLFTYNEQFSSSFIIVMVNTVIRIIVFMGIALLIDHLVQIRKEVDMLERLLPICSFCKKIRNKDNSWVQVEAYFSEPGKLSFSHGVCPECIEKHYGDFVKTMPKKIGDGESMAQRRGVD